MPVVEGVQRAGLRCDGSSAQAAPHCDGDGVRASGRKRASAVQRDGDGSLPGCGRLTLYQSPSLFISNQQ